MHVLHVLDLFLGSGFNISYPPTSPHQVLQAANTYQLETVLNCEVSYSGNDSDVSWVWLQDGVVLPDSNSTGDSTLIVIFNDDPEAAEGLYSCVATLSDGNTTSADIQLTLEGILYHTHTWATIANLHCIYIIHCPCLNLELA